MPAEFTGGAARRELSAPRRRLFSAITLLLPILLLALAELGLRALGVGGSYPLFVDAPDLPGYLCANPEVMRRYSAATATPLAFIEPILFKREKPPDGYRIVVQGGSAAAGFPYGRWGGLAGMLGDRLEADFPDREIEVITTAMAAVNSYTLLDLVDEIIEIEPDAVLIYAGHNEYLGVLGVGSALTSRSSRRATLLTLELRRLRLVQAIQWSIALAKGALVGAEGADRHTLFERAARGALIPFGSAAYERGVEQLEANLGEILERYRRGGIPVYVGTLASNEKDLPPFKSGLDARVDRDAWERIWRSTREAEAAGDAPAARRALSELLELDRDSADAWYALAEWERRAGRLDAAREAYRRAKDLDQLRFRAPEDFNRAIRSLAARHGAALVDVQQQFADASPQGIIGDELLLEHVHPNAEGYFLLADAYHEALRRDARIGDWSRAPSRSQARRDMPITAVDRILADYDVRELKAAYPFRETPQQVSLPAPADEIERLAQQRRRGELDWLHSMDGLLQVLRREGRIAEAAVVARLVAQAYPADRAPNFAAGVLLLEVGQFARARRYLERSLVAEPDDPAALGALVRADRALGDAARAREHLAELQRIAPGHPLLQRGSHPRRSLED